MSAWLLAPVLIGRLRLDGRGQPADAVALVLRRASIPCEPMLDPRQLNGSVRCRIALTQRLRGDGLGELVDAIEASWWAFETKTRGEEATRTVPAAAKREPPADLVPLRALGDELGRGYSAGALTHAVIAKLRAEGRDVLAGAIMLHWVDARRRQRRKLHASASARGREGAAHRVSAGQAPIRRC